MYVVYRTMKKTTISKPKKVGLLPLKNKWKKAYQEGRIVYVMEGGRFCVARMASKSPKDLGFIVECSPCIHETVNLSTSTGPVTE